MMKLRFTECKVKVPFFESRKNTFMVTGVIQDNKVIQFWGRVKINPGDDFLFICHISIYSNDEMDERMKNTKMAIKNLL